MNNLLYFVFNNKRYNQIISTYELLKNNYSKALEVWLVFHINQHTGFDLKKYIVDNYDEIIQLNRWMDVTNELLTYKAKAVKLFFLEKGLGTVPELNYQTYKDIALNEETINYIYSCYLTFLDIKKNYKEAFDIFICGCDKKDKLSIIKNTAVCKNYILQIDNVLNICHDIESKYPLVWSLLSYDRSFEEISFAELEGISKIKESALVNKEKIYKINEEKTFLLPLIIGENNYDIEQFDDDEINLENLAIELIDSDDIPPVTQEVTCLIEDLSMKKKAILGSLYYCDDFKLFDNCSISTFYELRRESDRIGVQFDELLNYYKANYDLIEQYNIEKYGKNDSSLQDLISAYTPNSELHIYIDDYRNISTLRKTVSSIARNYPRAINDIYGCISLETIGLDLLKQIVRNESGIKKRELELRLIEENRIKELQLRKQEEQKKLIKMRLLNCVSDWYSHTWNGSVKHKWYCDYYSYQDHKNCATYEMWDSWKFIWNFKNDPSKNINSFEHEKALNRAIEWVEMTLDKTFGAEINKLTLVCLTASSRIKNDNRFKLFAEKVCEDLNMNNAYSHISIVSDGEAKHEGGTISVGKSYDSNWFKDKFIVLFDDVRTSGRGIESEKIILESFGATVICAITLAQTTHMNNSL